jgi:hypothetical protein
MGSALEVHLPVPLEPSCPGLPNCRGEDEVIPEVEEDVNVDEVTDVLRSAFSQYLFVDTGSIRSIRQIIGERGTAPSNVEWQLHQAGRLCEFRFFNIIGNGHGPRRGTEGQTSSARHAWILRLGHCLAVSCSGILDFRGSRCGVLAGQRRSRERAYVHRVVARVVGALRRARLSASPAARGPATSSGTVTALNPPHYRPVARGCDVEKPCAGATGDYLRAMGGAAILGKRFLLCPPRSTRCRNDNVFPGRWLLSPSVRYPRQTSMFYPLPELGERPSRVSRPVGWVKAPPRLSWHSEPICAD